MKIPHIFAATGLVVAAMTASTSAEAQRWHGDDGWHGDRGWLGDRDWRGDRGWGRDHYWGHDRGWHRGYWRRADYGWRYPRCWTEWRWHHRVRICR